MKSTETALEKLTTKGTALQSKFGTQRDAIAVLGPPAPGNADLLADWEALAQWATGAIPAQREAAQAAAAAATRHREDATAKTQALIEECASLDIDAKGDVVAGAHSSRTRPRHSYGRDREDQRRDGRGEGAR